MKQYKLSFFSSSFLWLLLLLFLVHHLATTAGNVANLVTETCKICAQKSLNVNYDFCVTSLQADPRSEHADFQGLGIIALEVAIANASDTVESINKMLGNESSDKYCKGCLKDCLELHTDVIPTLEELVKELEHNNCANANIWISSAMDAATTCEDGFEEVEAVSPLKEQNNNMLQLSAIALVITNISCSLYDRYVF